MAQYVLDVIAARIGWAPPWYLRLRSGLTGVATVCLLASLLAASIQPGLIESFSDGSASNALIEGQGSSAIIFVGT